MQSVDRDADDLIALDCALTLQPVPSADLSFRREAVHRIGDRGVTVDSTDPGCTRTIASPVGTWRPASVSPIVLFLRPSRVKGSSARSCRPTLDG